VFDLFSALVAEGKTILMVTHDNELANRAPRVLTLADGLIVDETIRKGRRMLGGEESRR
jgi:putative ABC transport system ATP-binding protein